MEYGGDAARVCFAAVPSNTGMVVVEDVVTAWVLSVTVTVPVMMLECRVVVSVATAAVEVEVVTIPFGISLVTKSEGSIVVTVTVLRVKWGCDVGILALAVMDCRDVDEGVPVEVVEVRGSGPRILVETVTASEDLEKARVKGGGSALSATTSLDSVRHGRGVAEEAAVTAPDPERP